MELGALLVTMVRGSPPLDTDDPYNILGIQKSASDRVVKAAFRAGCFDYHPDTGKQKDQQKFERIVEAYNKIEKERRNQK